MTKTQSDMTQIELIRKKIERLNDLNKQIAKEQGSSDFIRGITAGYAEILSFLDTIEEQDMGEFSDGYHTFNELYYYRMLYNAAFFNLLPKEWVHKSKRHHTGEECFGGGWFIVMVNLPTGQISNHYELKDWDLFKISEKEFADEWDGHTPQEAAERLHKYLTLQELEMDLKAAARRHSEKEAENGYDYCDDNGIPYYNADTLIRTFKAGAKWMAGQGETIEDEVGACQDAEMTPLVEVGPKTFKVGDKVIVQIRKK